MFGSLNAREGLRVHMVDGVTTLPITPFDVVVQTNHHSANTEDTAAISDRDGLSRDGKSSVRFSIRTPADAH